MAIGGAMPSACDREEFRRMGAEKLAAFNESWNAMALQTFRANQELALSIVGLLWNPWGRSWPSFIATSRRMSTATLGVLGQGMAPVHRRAVANAKRLRRTKLR
jgi:hypothetical protein